MGELIKSYNEDGIDKAAGQNENLFIFWVVVSDQ